MKINHNIAALNTYRQLASNNVVGSKSLEKLSSGYRINRAADDAAGLAISEKMRGQIRGLDQAVRNSQDGISMLQTAEGALNESHSILQRMRELAVQSANDTNTDADRSQIQEEIGQLEAEVDRIANTTEFNTKKLLDGAMGQAVAAQTATELEGTAAGYLGNGAGVVVTGTVLTSLTDATSNGFGIVSGDSIIITGKKGDTYLTVTLSVTAAMDFQDLMDTVSNTFAGSGAVTIGTSGQLIVTGAVGKTNDIGAITFTVKTSSGDIRQAATNALSALEKTASAKDTQADGTNSFLIGANQGQIININVDSMDSYALGVHGLKVETKSQAEISIKLVDNAISTVSTQRSTLGAIQNRLEHTIANLGTASENLTASESNIRDVDMAKEMMQFTKNSILSQAATAMLAQANQLPQSVLSLLQ